MKFEILSSTLAKALKVIVKVIPQKTTTAIFNNLLVVLKGGRLMVTASNGETSITTCLLPAAATEEGSFVVDARLLNDYVNALPGDSPVTFEAKDNAVSIVWAKGSTSIPAFDPKDYPATVSIKDGGKYVLDAKELFAALEATVPAAAKDDIRPVMCCVAFEMKDGKMTLVASDAHILTAREVKVIQGEDAASMCLVNSSPAQLLADIVKGADKVLVSHNQRNIEFNTGLTIVRVTLAEGQYPAWRSIVPKSFAGTMTLERSLFLETIKRIGVVGGATITLDNKGEGIVISGGDISRGSTSTESLDGTREGDPIEITTKNEYLETILASYKVDKVKISYISPTQAVLITSCDENAKRGLSIAMPVVR